ILDPPYKYSPIRASGAAGISPDPYVTLRVRTSPNAKQQTSVQHENIDPEWNENFLFYLNPDKKNTLELTIMDDDFGLDKTLGVQEVELDDLPVDKEVRQAVQFGERTLLDIILLVKFNESEHLRISYDLCEDEREFLIKRRDVIFEKMSAMFDDETKPKTVNEVPVIAIMGSGGGYRAACGLSGAFCALQEAGILDCATYVTGLSGSSWYISTLYVQEKWPESSTCEELAAFLRKRFKINVLRHFRPEFKRKVRQKHKIGQPVAFTDIFGMALGDALLQDQDAKLSHQVHKVIHGQSALPVTTGIRVRNDTSAEVCSEWIEFTPFEFGMAKIGVFGKVSEFGGKYYKGRLVKKFEESPLHYLLGIWGSAFSILLNRVVDIEKHMQKLGETARQELERVILKETGRLKSEEDDSDDDDLPDDEIQTSGNWVTEMLKPSNLFTSRRGKAAETFNFCRGMQTKKEEDEEYSKLIGKEKTMCVVTVRDINGDDELPFVELLKAEQWAKGNGLPFPQIQGNPITEDPILRECYVFENKDDVTCPTILHFPIINKTFRSYLKPGVPRVTKEDKDFADFRIFDDPNEPYSSFKFQYDNKTFDRLHELMKFNTRLNIDTIKEKIATYVDYRRNNPEYAK
ncbi:cytosolic phospholipase A2, partial [Paramuricea clavata]